MNEIKHIETITEMHRILPGKSVKHPLVALIDFSNYNEPFPKGTRFTMGFYTVLFKNRCVNKLKYGQQTYDFQDGSLMCIAPRQVITLAEPDTEGEEVRGWGLFFHPDFIRGTSLGKNIKAYSFFDYQTSEALHLSDKEKQNLCEIAQKIDRELSENIDRHSQMLLASNIELLLNYCVRYYDRQFITRTNANQDVVMKVDEILADYFQQGNLSEKGLPSVKQLAEQVHLSPNYLSDMLKRETGMNAQDRIHYHLIEEAKSQLLNTNKNISELAYGLGFEYPPYFSRLFKNKTGMTPAEFRRVG